jgi:two-component system response regulator AtoC
MPESIRVLVVDDDETFRKTIARELRHMGFEVAEAAGGAEALDEVRRETPSVVLLDIRMPGMDGLQVLAALREEAAQVQVLMLTGQGTVEDAVQAMKEGAYDYLVKPCPLDELEVSIRKAAEKGHLLSQNALLHARLARQDRPGGIVGDGAAVREVLDVAERVASSDSTVLVHGESGVGKELVARVIHDWSTRAEQPFVVIDCTSLQETLLESELFGHERGAYTSATALKHGLFEVADSGTILLDEIGELSPAIQAKLLRVLETGTFRRVGGNKSIQVDVRVIAATNRDLQRLVEEDHFRRDLFFRLHVVSIEVPPLRDRREDIPVLARHFMEKARRSDGEQMQISAEALQALIAYSWPGNIRELQNAIERTALLADGAEIMVSDLPEAIQPSADDGGPGESPLHSLRDAERAHIVRVLQQVDGHRGQAAAVLGISERQLYRKIHDHGL